MCLNEISIIVPTYNSSWKKTKLTLLSCLKQKNIKIEIIITDDHSSDNHFDIIKAFFRKNNFYNYTLISAEANRGTCMNFYEGLRKAHYQYIKGIAPGDLLHASDTLEKWVAFMQQNNIRASFCRNVFYKPENDTLVPFVHTEIPNYIECYRNDSYNYRRCRYIYVVNRDYIVGVNCIFERELCLHYLKTLIDYGVKYCEDHIIWPMYWEGLEIRFYNEIGMWYEYDVDGITSSSRRIEWRERLLQDEDNTENILIDKENKNFFLNRLSILYRLRKTHKPWLIRLGKIVLFPMSVYWSRVIKTHKTMSCVTPDSSFVLSLLHDVEQER